MRASAGRRAAPWNWGRWSGSAPTRGLSAGPGSWSRRRDAQRRSWAAASAPSRRPLTARGKAIPSPSSVGRTAEVSFSPSPRSSPGKWWRRSSNGWRTSAFTSFPGMLPSPPKGWPPGLMPSMPAWMIPCAVPSRSFWKGETPSASRRPYRGSSREGIPRPSFSGPPPAAGA
ncbi:hypothetical protein SDC9_95451 [bioreactor metagenome]|uniref:Uncharacterized protein n=1 Tax=bioreactor metagenome TaxID=1076179 RepID=A0A645AGF0_9ZZZZ